MKEYPMRVVKTVAVITAAILLTFSTVNAKEFLVGVELPLTGAYARGGTTTLEGIKTATEIFNKHNPRHQIKLVIVDDESMPAKAVAAVEKLASEGVVGITGCYSSTICGPAATAAIKLGIPVITGGAPGVNLGHTSFFRINNNAGYTKAIVGLIGDMRVKSVSILTTSMKATHEVSKDVAKILTARGVKVTFHSFEPGVSDFKSLINKVKVQDHPEIIFMAGLENEYIGMLRALKLLKPDVKAIVGFWSLATSKMATEYTDITNNVFGTAMVPFPSTFTTAEGKEFEKTFNKLYKTDPDYMNEFGYVESVVMFEAIKRADEKGTLAKGGLTEEIRKTDRSTPMGRVAFGVDGDNINFTQWFGQFQKGKILIVWPKEHANGKMNYPATPWK
jgi:branched-chain amino acid transport system substrate-binding protein